MIKTNERINHLPFISIKPFYHSFSITPSSPPNKNKTWLILSVRSASLPCSNSRKKRKPTPAYLYIWDMESYLFNEQRDALKGLFNCPSEGKYSGLHKSEDFFKLLETDFPDEDWEKRITTTSDGLKDYYISKKR